MEYFVFDNTIWDAAIGEQRFGVLLFIDSNDTGDWQKWGFWLVYKIIFCHNPCFHFIPPSHQMTQHITSKTGSLQLHLCTSF
jgi:hypothetical protein